MLLRISEWAVPSLKRKQRHARMVRAESVVCHDASSRGKSNDWGDVGEHADIWTDRPVLAARNTR